MRRDTGPMLLRGVSARTFSIGDFEGSGEGGVMSVGPGMFSVCAGLDTYQSRRYMLSRRTGVGIC